MKTSVSTPAALSPAGPGGTLSSLRSLVLRIAERFNLSPVGTRLARGMCWTLVGAFIARGLGIVASICVARMLGREGFGEFGVIQSTVGMFSAFAGFGLGLTATKHVAEYRRTDPAKAGRVMAMSGMVATLSGTVLALSLAMVAPWLAERALAAPHLEAPLRISAWMILLGALNGAQTGALSGLEAFKTMARVSLWTGVASFPILVAGVWMGGLNGAVWGLAASLAFNWVLNHLALRVEAGRARVPLGFDGCGKEWSLLRDFGLPAMLCNLMIVPVHWVCTAMLASQPGGYLEMGIFNAANQWRMAILFVPHAMAGMILPALAGLHGVGDQAGHSRTLRVNVALIGGVALGLAFGVILFSDVIIRSYGTGFDGGLATLVLLSLSAVAYSVNQALGVGLISQGRMWHVLACNAGWAIALLLSALWFVPVHGAFGLAVSMLIAYPLQSVCMLALSARAGNCRSQASTCSSQTG